MNNVTTIIFDCFGVLYPDYAANYFARHSQLFLNNPGLLGELFSQIDLGKISQDEFYGAISAVANIPIAEIKAEMEAELVFDPELVKLIKQLKHKYKIGLLSNAGSDEIEILMKDGLGKLFDVMTVSYEVGDVKPNAKIFEVCLERLGSKPSESVFIDDSPKNLEGTRAVGLQTVHYPEFGKLPKELLELV